MHVSNGGPSTSGNGKKRSSWQRRRFPSTEKKKQILWRGLICFFFAPMLDSPCLHSLCPERHSWRTLRLSDHYSFWVCVIILQDSSRCALQVYALKQTPPVPHWWDCGMHSLAGAGMVATGENSGKVVIYRLRDGELARSMEGSSPFLFCRVFLKVVSSHRHFQSQQQT